MHCRQDCFTTGLLEEILLLLSMGIRHVTGVLLYVLQAGSTTEFVKRLLLDKHNFTLNVAKTCT